MLKRVPRKEKRKIVKEKEEREERKREEGKGRETVPASASSLTLASKNSAKDSAVVKCCKLSRVIILGNLM